MVDYERVRRWLDALGRYVATIVICTAPTPISAGAASFPLQPAPNQCRKMLEPSVPHAALRAVAPSDIAGIRDIGGPDDYQSHAHPIGISPDHRWAAVMVRRGIPAWNAYCIGLVIIPLSGQPGPPQLLDVGGELMRRRSNQFGLVNMPSGLPRVAPPIWSPDGSEIAYLRQDAGRVRVWTAGFDGAPSRPVSPTAFDPSSFAWSGNSNQLLITGSPPKEPPPETTDEAGTGYRFDKRFWPLSGSSPRETGPLHIVEIAVDVARPGPPRSDTGADPDHLRGEGVAAKDGTDVTVSLEPLRPELSRSPNRLHAHWRTGDATCQQIACSNVSDFWVANNGRDVVFLALGGPGRSTFGLYRWSPHDGSVKTLIETQDIICGCSGANDLLICEREGPISPRSIVGISMTDGRVTTLYDPNPEFASLELASPKRMFWRNRYGITTFGDLLLPKREIGSPLPPLVVVQYDSRGFLRGGTGDEYPIQPLVAQGFAVLSFSRPIDFASARSPIGVPKGDRTSLEHWHDRRSIYSSLETIVSKLVSDRLVDPRRIAITGLSDGASTAGFALIHSRLFSAAIMSTCCDDPIVQQGMMGAGYHNFLANLGFPMSMKAWKPVSLRLQTNRIEVPILIQAADSEYLLALPTYEALKSAGSNVAMYVFPNEFHIKWQPEHRLAIYNRVIDWLNAWSRGRLQMR